MQKCKDCPAWKRGANYIHYGGEAIEQGICKIKMQNTLENKRCRVNLEKRGYDPKKEVKK